MVELIKLPMPPSANRQLTLAHGRFIKNSEARIFDGKIKEYELRNWRIIEAAQKEINSWLDKGLGLEIELFFVFHESRVFTKGKKAKSRFKRIDSNNRIKSSIDAVARLLDFDDMVIFKETAHKVTCKCYSEEQLIVRINPYEFKTIEQIQ
jgi:hypothetical protein